MKWKDFTQKLTEAKKSALETAQQYHQHFSVASSAVAEASDGTAGRQASNVGIWHSRPVIKTELFVEGANDGSALRDLPTVASGGPPLLSPPGCCEAAGSADTRVLLEGLVPYEVGSSSGGREVPSANGPSQTLARGVEPTEDNGMRWTDTRPAMPAPVPPPPPVLPSVVGGNTSCAPGYASTVFCAPEEGAVASSGKKVEDGANESRNKGLWIQTLKADGVNTDSEVNAAVCSGSMPEIHKGRNDSSAAGDSRAPQPQPPPTEPVGSPSGGSWAMHADLSAVPREKLEQAFEIIHRRSVRLSEELQEKEKLRSAASMLASEYGTQVQKLQEACTAQKEALNMAQREKVMYREQLENEQAQNGALRAQIVELNRQVSQNTTVTEELTQLRADLSNQVALLAKDAAVLRDENATLKDIVLTLEKEKEALVQSAHTCKIVDVKEAEETVKEEHHTCQNLSYVVPDATLISYKPLLRLEAEDPDVPPTEKADLLEEPAGFSNDARCVSPSAVDYQEIIQTDGVLEQLKLAAVPFNDCSICSRLIPLAPKLVCFLKAWIAMKDSEGAVALGQKLELELSCLLMMLRELARASSVVEFAGNVERVHPEIVAWIVHEQEALMGMCSTLIQRIETSPVSIFEEGDGTGVSFILRDRPTLLNYLKTLQRGLHNPTHSGNSSLQGRYRVVSISFPPLSAAEIGTITETLLSENCSSETKRENQLDEDLRQRVSYDLPEGNTVDSSQHRHSNGLSVASILRLYTELLNIFQIQVSELQYASREEDFTRAFGTVALVLETLEERMPKSAESGEFGTRARELFQTVVNVLRCHRMDINEKANGLPALQHDQRLVKDPLRNGHNSNVVEGARSPSESPTDTVIADFERQVKILKEDGWRIQEELQATRDAFSECKACLGKTQQSLMQANGQLRDSCATVSKLEEALSEAHRNCATLKKREAALEKALRPPKQSLLEEEGLQLRALLKVTVPEDGGRSWCCLRVEPRVPGAELKTSLNIRAPWNGLYWIPTAELESFSSGSELLDVQQVYGKEINAYQMTLQQQQQRVKILERQLEEVQRSFKAYQDKATVALRRQEMSKDPERAQGFQESLPNRKAGDEAVKSESREMLEGGPSQVCLSDTWKRECSSEVVARLRYTEAELEKEKREVERLEAHARQYALDVAKAEALLRDEREQHAQSKELRRTEALRFAEIQSSLEGRSKRLQDLLEKANQRIEQWSQKWVQQQSCNNVSVLYSKPPVSFIPNSEAKDYREQLAETEEHDNRRRLSSGVASQPEVETLTFATSRLRHSEGASLIRGNDQCSLENKSCQGGFTADLNECLYETSQQEGERNEEVQKAEERQAFKQPQKTEESLHLDGMQSERLASNVSSSGRFSSGPFNETPRHQSRYSLQGARFMPGLIATPSVKAWPSESQSLRRQLRVLERHLAEQKHQNALLFEQNACLKKELRKSEALLSIRFKQGGDGQENGGRVSEGLPDGVPLEFVRNTVLRFVQTSPVGGSEHESLIPVIASLFAFSRDEVRDVCRLRGEKGGFIKPWFG